MSSTANPGPREVLVRTAAAGVCHSDLHFQNGLHGSTHPPKGGTPILPYASAAEGASPAEGSYPCFPPTILGHESAGVVEAVGSDVSYVKAGDHVITCLSTFCGFCLTGHMSPCQEPEL